MEGGDGGEAGAGIHSGVSFPNLHATKAEQAGGVRTHVTLQNGEIRDAGEGRGLGQEVVSSTLVGERQ